MTLHPATNTVVNRKGPISLFDSLKTKYEAIFDDVHDWMAFKPKPGLEVYPCYSCRHIFSSKKSFLHHINRRASLYQYVCSECRNSVKSFYNRCSFLLHCREHFNMTIGVLNLRNLQIFPLAAGLAGFSNHPDVVQIYDVVEDLNVTDEINAQFYEHNAEDCGLEVVNMRAKRLVINQPGQPNLTLRQIAKNIPKCQLVFESDLPPAPQVKVEPMQEDEPTIESVTTPSTTPEVIRTPSPTTILETETLRMPVITKIESLDDTTLNGNADTSSTINKEKQVKCTECKETISTSLERHFLDENRFLREENRCRFCKLICPTGCSLSAHSRIHIKMPPFVCPDCGIIFHTNGSLITHMNEVCYHTAKSVRFRCPGKRCGKIFASNSTFGPHFKQTHFLTSYKCGLCPLQFSSMDECQGHMNRRHPDTVVNIVKFFGCAPCEKMGMSYQQRQQHVEEHCRDLSRCIYIFRCKFCKCYFRSVQTMATHLQNCRVQKTGISRRMQRAHLSGQATVTPLTEKYISGPCQGCGTRLIFAKSKPVTLCGKCGPSKKPLEKCVCILCKAQLDFDERRQHQLVCRYARPQVMVEQLDLTQETIEIHQLMSGSSNSDLEKGEEQSRPRKRIKTNYHRPKRDNDLTADDPISFDGIYRCRLCKFEHGERADFHQHIKEHRDISTAYQCMECGECFVVKPSLIKHLCHYHHIQDASAYMTANDCFDRGAVDELAKVVKAPYLINNVKENQCQVCQKECDTKEELDQHFRVHGMAFLMRTSI